LKLPVRRQVKTWNRLGNVKVLKIPGADVKQIDTLGIFSPIRKGAYFTLAPAEVEGLLVTTEAVASQSSESTPRNAFETARRLEPPA